MSDAFNLQPISTASVPQALERAMRYRLLNDPEQAESICLDVLEVDPGNQEALATLILALTDQFAASEASPGASRVAGYIDQLADEYKRNYYRGILSERQARAYLRRGMARVFAFDAFRVAMEWFEKAAALRPEGNDEALLRWNSCVRTIRRARLHPQPAEREQPLE